jgi:chromosome segregation ATPase
MNGQQQSSRGSRLRSAVTWTLKTVIRLLVTAILLVALAALIQYGISEINNEIDSSIEGVNRRIDVIDSSHSAVEQEIDLLFSDVGNLMEANQQQQDELDEARSQLGERVEVVDQLQADLARQGEILVGLEAQAAGLVTARESISESISAVGSGLVALQGDINENGSRIDQIGGQLDELAVQASEPDPALVALRDTLLLFRQWELIGRARLYLAENNPGLASLEIERLLAGLETATEAQGREVSQAQIVSRLTLALASLPDNPAAAARDLDAAWEVLDASLVDRLGLESTGSAPVSTEEAPEEATATAPAESTPGAPVEATPTPTPTPAAG